jgi:hypothetical protein
MAITRAEIKYNVYEKLNKSATTRGFFTDAKCNAAIQEAVDFVVAEMQIADDGYAHKMDNLDVPNGAVTIPIPPHMAMILEVRFLLGDVYVPLGYDQRFGDVAYNAQSGAVQFPTRYSVIDNCFYFSPAISVGGVGYLQVEYMAASKRLANDTDTLESQFDRSMMWWVCYRSCSILASNVGQFAKSWQAEEAHWYNQMKQIIFKRNSQVIPIREFSGG